MSKRYPRSQRIRAKENRLGINSSPNVIQQNRNDDTMAQDETARISPPILPPGEELIVIKGTLLKLETELTQWNFSYLNYANPEQQAANERSSQLKTIGMTAIALVNPAQAAALNSGSSTGYAPGKSAQSHFIYHAEISGYEGKPIRGWTGVTAAKVGDEVEMVVEWRGDHYEIYALLLPAKRLISIYPECVRGFDAYERYEFKSTLSQTSVVSFIVFLFVCILIIKLDGLSGFITSEYTDALWIVSGSFFLIVLFSMMLFFNPGIKKGMKRTTINSAERIFRALGWENVEKVDLVKSTRKKIRQLKKQKKYKKEFLEAPVFEMFESTNSMFYY